MNEIDATLVIDELRKQLADAHFQIALERARNTQLTTVQEST